MNLPPAPSKLCAECYETLRRHFLANRPLLEADPRSLTLLLQNGMACWMHAWQLLPQAAPNPIATCPPSGAPPLVPVRQQELTRLIAEMTVQHLHPANTL